jgi:hypothetical protein
MVVFLVLGIVLFVIAGITFWNRRKYAERMTLIRQAVPASAADIPNAFPGEIVSLTGNSRHDRPLVSEQTETPCVYYDFEIVRRYERRRGGFSISGPGRRRNRGRQRRKETVAENTQWVPFHLEDNGGYARVNPEGAHFEARQVLNRYEREDSNNLFGIPGLDINIGFGGDRTLGYEIRENVIPVGAPVFVVGPVDENGEIGRANGNSNMIVSYRAESDLRDDWGKRERRQLIGAAAAAGLAVIMLFGAVVAFVISLF